MMTISGVSVTPDRGTIPPLEDFAYGLKQIVRFGGQTVVSWTVIQHLLACMQVAREEHRTQSILPALEEMYCGMHDMHEALTSDVPNGFKTESFEELQDDLDVRIWRRFGLPSLDGQLAMREYIKQVDRRMLLAEAAVVTPEQMIVILNELDTPDTRLEWMLALRHAVTAARPEESFGLK